MRFARHAKIFRGPLDAAPVAAVLMLLLMFMLLGSLVYTPGVLVELGQTVMVTSSNTIALAGKTYAPGELDQFRADLKRWPSQTSFSVALEPGADPKLADQISGLLKASQTITVTSSNTIALAGKIYALADLDQLKADIKRWPVQTSFAVAMEPGADRKVAQTVSNLFQLTLPGGTNLAGTDNATVVVAVNFRGQCFYDNHMVDDSELKAELVRRLQRAARDAKQLTMILQLDKAAENQVLTHLFGLAREAGISEVLLAERPPMSGPQP